MQPLLQWKNIKLLLHIRNAFVDFVIQHAISMRHIVICVLCGSTTFFHIIPLTSRFYKKIVIEHKICVLIFSTTFVWNISHSKNSWARYGHKYILVFMYSTVQYSTVQYSTVQYTLFLSNLNETWMLSTDFRKKNSRIIFLKNPFSGSRAIPCGRMDRWTDRYDEGNSRFLQFYKRISKTK